MRHVNQVSVLITLMLILAVVAPGVASADQLQVDAAAPWWVRIGALALLWGHIGGGTVGLLSGTVALLSRKGGKLHRAAGNVFLVSMLIMSGIGGAVAPLLHDRISTVAGFMTFYLVFTGWLTARRREGVSVFEIAGLGVAIVGVISTYVLVWLASHAPGGTLDGSPYQGFYVFAFVSTVAALSDLKLVLRGGISGAQRVARHVWRMTFGLFVATGSLFLGQMQVFPQWLQDTPVLYLAGLAPLPFLVFWMLRVRLSKKWRGAARAQAPLPA